MSNGKIIIKGCQNSWSLERENRIQKSPNTKQQC